MPTKRTNLNLALLLIIQLVFWQVGTSYDHFLTLSGYLAINFMSLTLLLATRPAWLETPLGGLDSIYQLHKWTGIFAVFFALSHWLIEMWDDGLKAILGRDRSQKEGKFSGWLDTFQDAAEDLGEPGLYILLFLVAITLLRLIPYHYWRYLHKAMPLIYLTLAAHALLLAPPSWWQQSTGWVMALLILGGLFGSIQSLTGSIGKNRRYQGIIKSVESLSNQVTQVVCDLGKQWPGHQAGQFALVTFNKLEGAHPFTLSSADKTNGQLSFQIKALGDYTRKIPQHLHSGQPVLIEGPYGRFNPAKGRKNAQQIWVAGGIGVTPFLAALESHTKHPERYKTAINLYYCTSAAETDPLVARLKQLVESTPDISLHIYDSQQGQRLTTDQLAITSKQVDIWFCGPNGLAKALLSGLKKQPVSLRFHQELFEFR